MPAQAEIADVIDEEITRKTFPILNRTPWCKRLACTEVTMAGMCRRSACTKGYWTCRTNQSGESPMRLDKELATRKESGGGG